MQRLEALTQAAAAFGAGAPSGIPDQVPTGDESEVARIMQICNACRYCEGFCAVFPAMARRLEFGKFDVHYLSNLCHNCGSCLHACQYASPHEFAVNVPQAMAKVRVQTYADYAWPSGLGALYRRNGLALALALAAGLTLFLLLAVALNGTLWHIPQGGNFYSIFPHNLMVFLFAPIFLFAVLALALGVRDFWKKASPEAATMPAVREAARDGLCLRYLGGGHGEGCNNADDAFTLTRRRFHHFTFYGFMLCFAATCVATLYHYVLGWQAPYGYASVPKLLGIVGGLALMVGTVGLFLLNLARHPDHGDAAQKTMDRGFIALLFLTALTGLVLMLWHDSAVLALLLSIHLGVVMALFATLPYGKFAHGIYRMAAMLKWAIERRQPTKLQLGDD